MTVENETCEYTHSPSAGDYQSVFIIQAIGNQRDPLGFQDKTPVPHACEGRPVKKVQRLIRFPHRCF